MGTYYEWVADLDATEVEAAALGQRVVDALVVRGVLLPHLSSDAALGGVGHPPGPAWADTVARAVSGETPWGMQVRVGREVHDGGQSSVDAVTCPRCAVRRSFYGPPEEFGPTCQDEEGLRWFYDAAAAWSDGGEVALGCRSCGAATTVAEWRTDDAALACLGFVFWGWDELRPEVAGWVAEATGGHRIMYGSGKV